MTDAQSQEAAAERHEPAGEAPEPGGAGFRSETAAAVHELRRALDGVIGQLPGPIARASELQHALGVDKALAWRVFNAVGCTDAFAAARYLPRSAGIRSFLVAARRSGVQGAPIEAVTAAVEALEQVVKAHAGDRKRFDMLLASHSVEGKLEADLVHRRTAFEGNTYVWGASADVQLRTAFLAPSEREGYADMANLRGLLGLEFLRPAMSWPVGVTWPRQDDMRTSRRAAIEPLFDLEQVPGDAASLFLSDPGLRIEAHRSEDGGQRYEVSTGEVGATGAVSCVTGDIVRPVGALTAEAGSQEAGAMTTIDGAALHGLTDKLNSLDLTEAEQPPSRPSSLGPVRVMPRSKASASHASTSPGSSRPGARRSSATRWRAAIRATWTWSGPTGTCST